MNETFKVVLFGEPTVGKTSLLTRILTRTFNSSYISTVGSGCGIWTKCNGVTKTNLQIWDTAGQEKYRSLGRIFFKNAAAGILVVSKEHPPKVEDLERWFKEFKTHATEDAVVVLCANKQDLPDNTEDEDVIRQWADSQRLPYIETSAKTGLGVSELFSYVALRVSHKETYSLSSLPLISGSAEKYPFGVDNCCKI